MMDIALIQTENGIDINFNHMDFKKEESLKTAILISLFSEQRHEGEKGWWGDLVADRPGDQIGSTLWTLRREKMTPQTIRKVEEAAKSCLSWLVDDRIVSSVEVKASRSSSEGIALTINLTKDKKVTTYSIVWNGEVR